ncbi:MAG: ACP S-malonyltransferase [Clostridiaceae bacterium]|nr:ACP S-malonyltransferase [Clostridiaceae bacterium]
MEKRDPGIVFLYGGQGSQQVGMEADFVSPEFSARSSADYQLREIVDLYGRVFAVRPDLPEAWREEDSLTLTRNAQPALALHALALTAVLKSRGIRPAAALGLSIGEFPALAALDVLSPDKIVDIVLRRAELMDDRLNKRRADGAVDGMTAVLGLDAAIIAGFLAENGSTASIANLNSPTQVVLSGTCDELDSLEPGLIALGARRVQKLEVEGAFHSSVFAETARIFASDLAKYSFKQPRGYLPLNVFGCSREEAVASSVSDTAQPVKLLESSNSLKPTNLQEVPVLPTAMAMQMAASVRLDDCFDALLRRGYCDFVEIAAKPVLNNLLRRKSKEINVYTVRDLAETESFIAEYFAGNEEHIAEDN